MKFALNNTSPNFPIGFVRYRLIQRVDYRETFGLSRRDEYLVRTDESVNRGTAMKIQGRGEVQSIKCS